MTESYTIGEQTGEVVLDLTFVAYKNPVDVRLNIINSSLQIRKHRLRVVSKLNNQASFSCAFYFLSGSHYETQIS